jgi:CheY-like chemotaxis protein
MNLPPMNLKDKRILIVEDDELLRECLVEEFEYLGAKIDQAGSGSAAFSLISERTFDVVLTDVRMPGGDGIELLDKVRNLDFRKPIVAFVSGISDLTDAEAYSRGAAAIFPKPFDLTEIVATVLRLTEIDHGKWPNIANPQLDAGKLRLNFGTLNAAIASGAFNLGSHGMFIGTADSLPRASANMPFEIEFTETRQKLVGDGIVRWIRKTINPEGARGFGVEFLNLESASAEILEAYLCASQPKAHIPKG